MHETLSATLPWSSTNLLHSYLEDASSRVYGPRESTTSKLSHNGVTFRVDGLGTMSSIGVVRDASLTFMTVESRDCLLAVACLKELEKNISSNHWQLADPYK